MRISADSDSPLKKFLDFHAMIVQSSYLQYRKIFLARHHFWTSATTAATLKLLGAALLALSEELHWPKMRYLRPIVASDML